MQVSVQDDLELMKEKRRLREELAEVKKENLFLRKSSGILCKGNRLEAYRFIDEYRDLFGVQWLLQRLEIYPNIYYNYRKHKRAKEAARKRDILHQIQAIYHETNGVAGYCRMRIYLSRNGIELSALTVHKYMNTELGLLHSIVRVKSSEISRRHVV